MRAIIILNDNKLANSEAQTPHQNTLSQASEKCFLRYDFTPFLPQRRIFHQNQAKINTALRRKGQKPQIKTVDCGYSVLVNETRKKVWLGAKMKIKDCDKNNPQKFL